MNKKKIIFSLSMILLLLTSSICLYNNYDVIKLKKDRQLTFNEEVVLYDIFDNIYTIDCQLKDLSKKEIAPSYISASDEEASQFFYNKIVYNQEFLDQKKNIKYYAQSNNNTLSNTNDDLKNINQNKKLRNKYQWYIKISFDSNGLMTYDTLNCNKGNQQNYEIIWNNYKQNLKKTNHNIILHNPTNLTLYFAVPTKLVSNTHDVLGLYSPMDITAYRIESIIPLVIIAGIFSFVFILIYPYQIEKEVPIFGQVAKIKIEILVALYFFSWFSIAFLLQELIGSTLNHSLHNHLVSIGLAKYASIIVVAANLVAWIVLMYLCMFGAYYLKTCFKTGLVKMAKENTVVSWIYAKIKLLINKIYCFDFSNNVNKTILKIVLVNCLIILIVCHFFTMGIVFALVYSVILFVVLKKKFVQINQNYQILLNALQSLSNGNFNVTINEDIGMFNSLADEFVNIKNGFEKAVNEEVKSQKMRTELITNVSHDLKTPLTTIITYVDLLKEPNLPNEKQQEYLNSIDHSALRLKHLIEDLFEVSKVNSGNINLNIVDVDLIALIKQAIFELNDQFKAKNLIFKTNFPKEKIILALDSSKTYRIFENLLTNISKYALNNTRVYIDFKTDDDIVTIIFKNISAYEIRLSEIELVERFVQGDSSRNSSGSGLGLAIAKSFTEIQNGIFKINIDGDLFKVTVCFKLK